MIVPVGSSSRATHVESRRLLSTLSMLCEVFTVPGVPVLSPTPNLFPHKLEDCLQSQMQFDIIYKITIQGSVSTIQEHSKNIQVNAGIHKTDGLYSVS